jgi:hypothetical protein
VLIPAWFTAKFVQMLWAPLAALIIAFLAGWRPGKGTVAVAAIIVLLLAADAAVIFLRYDPVVDLLRHTVSRLILQIAPLVYLLAADAFIPLLGSRSATSTARGRFFRQANANSTT